MEIGEYDMNIRKVNEINVLGRDPFLSSNPLDNASTCDCGDVEIRVGFFWANLIFVNL